MVPRDDAKPPPRGVPAGLLAGRRPHGGAERRCDRVRAPSRPSRHRPTRSRRRRSRAGLRSSSTGRTGRIARARAGPPRPAVAVAVPRRVGGVRSVEGRLGRDEPRRNGHAAVAGGAIRGGPDHERRRVADQPARARRRWRPLVERLAQRRSDQPTQRQARGVRSVAAVARCGSHSSSRASSSSRPLTLRPS